MTVEGSVLGTHSVFAFEVALLTVTVHVGENATLLAFKGLDVEPASQKLLAELENKKE